MSTTSLIAQQDTVKPKTKKQSIFNFLYDKSDSLPIIQIRTDYKNLLKFKLKEEYQPASLTIWNEENETLDFEKVRVRARGNIRKEVCINPPLKINFKGRELKSNGLSGKHEVLKLVLPCSKGAGNAQSVYREHLIYQLYNELSSYGYRTRMVKVIIIDHKERSNEFISFLIENEDEYAHRLNARILETGKINRNALERNEYLRMSFFQYMILNTDWSIWSKHNIEFIKVPEVERVIPVPYDFDYCGMISNSYAVPSPTLPIDLVSEPYYLGRGVSKEEALATAAFFRSKRDVLFKIVDDFGYSSESEKRDAYGCLKRFYKTLENDKRVIRIFANAKD
jgi:hypothetical protein